MRFTTTIFLLLCLGSFSQDVTINAAGQPSTVYINASGIPSSLSINRPIPVNMYSLDGVDDYISVPQTTLSFNYTDAQSYEIWFKLNSVGAVENILSLYDPITTKGTKIFIDAGGYIHFYARNASQILDVSSNEVDNFGTDQKVFAPRWLHLVVTYDGSGAGGVQMYVDDHIMIMTTVTNTLASSPENSSTVVFGKEASSYTAMGLGITRVFNKQLTAGEITTLYNDGIPLTRTTISNKVFELLLDDKFNGTNYTVRESANGINGTGYGSLSGMDINMLIRNGNQAFNGSLAYNTFGLSYDTGLDIYDSPYSDKRTNIFYDSTDDRTYMSWQQGPYLGGSRQSMIMYVDHTNGYVSPSYPVGYLEAGAYDNHNAPSCIVTNDNEVLVGHENLHTSPIYFKKTIGKDISNTYSISNIPTDNSYPAFCKLGSTLAVVTRGQLMKDYISLSTNNGATWGTRKYLLNMNNSTGVDRAYFDVIYHPTKLVLLVREREDALGYYPQVYYIESSDGYNFSNIDGSFSKNINVENIFRGELDTNCLVRQAETDVYIKCAAFTENGMIGFGNEGEDEYVYIWWDGDSWVTKPLGLPNFIPGASIGNTGRGDSWFVHVYSATHQVLWRLELRGGFDVVVQYETTDAWDTWDAGTIISATDKNHQQLQSTYNTDATKKILSANQVVGDGNTNIWIYEYIPTE